MSEPKREYERLKMISFRIDEETYEVLLRLEAAVEGGIVNKRRRSIAIRQALQEAGKRLAIRK